MVLRKRKNLKSSEVPAVVAALLETEFWLPQLNTMVPLVRLQDDHDGTRDGKLALLITPDGDIRVWVAAEDPMYSTLRFRTYDGGGLSLRTRRALLILAEAIRLDNEEIPM